MQGEANKDQEWSLGEGVRNKKGKVKEGIRLNNKRRKVNKIKKKKEMQKGVSQAETIRINTNFPSHIFLCGYKTRGCYYLVLVPKSNNVFSMIPTTGKITKK